MDEQGRVFAVFPIAELSEKMGKCRSSVKNALKELEDAGWIVRKFSDFQSLNIYMCLFQTKKLYAQESRGSGQL